MNGNINGTSHQTCDHVVFTEFGDGEGVLVDLNTRRYYQLNETAMLIWRALEKKRARAEIIEEITNAYAVSAEHAEQSLDKLIERLLTYKLVCADEPHSI
jgi:Coenzyme PQQ synthesis protein D (PqqD)